MVWGGRREEGSGWGTHVYLGRIHLDILQNQHNIVKFKKKKKESACNAGGLDLILWSGRSPGEGNGTPLQYSCLENPMDSGACGLQSMGLQSDRTE